MEEKNEEFISKDELNRAIKSVYTRNNKNAKEIVDIALKDIRERIGDNTNNINDLQQRLHNVELAVYPLKEAVENIKDDVKEIKSDIKEGFKELKDDFKDYKADNKESLDEFKAEVKKEVNVVAEEVGDLSSKYYDHDKRILNAETSKGFKEWIKTTEGIVVATITTAGPVIIILIQTLNR